MLAWGTKTIDDYCLLYSRPSYPLSLDRGTEARSHTVQVVTLVIYCLFHPPAPAHLIPVTPKVVFPEGTHGIYHKGDGRLGRGSGAMGLLSRSDLGGSEGYGGRAGQKAQEEMRPSIKVPRHSRSDWDERYGLVYIWLFQTVLPVFLLNPSSIVIFSPLRDQWKLQVGEVHQNAGTAPVVSFVWRTNKPRRIEKVIL